MKFFATPSHAQGILLTPPRDHSLCGLGDHNGCWGSNLDWLHARQVPYSLCYDSSFSFVVLKAMRHRVWASFGASLISFLFFLVVLGVKEGNSCFGFHKRIGCCYYVLFYSLSWSVNYRCLKRRLKWGVSEQLNLIVSDTIFCRSTTIGPYRVPWLNLMNHDLIWWWLIEGWQCTVT